MMRHTGLPVRPGVKQVYAVDAPAARPDRISSVLRELPVFREVASQIGMQELRRRLVHMSPALLPFLLWVIPHQDPWGPILINSFLVVTIALVGHTLYRFRSIARSHDEQGMAAVIGYAVPITLLALFFPDRGELAMMTLGIIGLGDGSATLGGLWFGGRRLPWNQKKSVAGLLCFCLIGTLFATIIYWGEARPGVSWQVALLCASLATVAAGFVESLPLRWNDNLRVGTTAAIVGAMVQIVWLGR